MKLSWFLIRSGCIFLIVKVGKMFCWVNSDKIKGIEEEFLMKLFLIFVLVVVVLIIIVFVVDLCMLWWGGDLCYMVI